MDGEGGKWYHIQSGSVTGYIKAQYFATGEEASKIAREVGTTYAKVTNTSTLRLRETPSLEGKTLDLLSADAEYEVIGEEGDFAKISVDNDLVGYVYKDYITTQVDFKQAVSVAEEQQQKAEEEKLKQEANAAIENLEQVKKKAEEESRAAETTAAAKKTTAAAKETTKASETSYSGTIEANPSESKAAGTTAAAKETTKAAETKAPTTAAATKAPTASGVGPGGGPGTGGTSSSGNEVTNATRSAVVAYAKQFCPKVQFSPEDATRSDFSFLCRMIRAALDAGADCINIPDTVGYATPEEFAGLIRHLHQAVPALSGALCGVHCHDDLGLAVANSLAAVGAGAGRVECTVNGLGERAGNAALEEIVMALHVRGDILGADTNICTRELVRTSRMAASLTAVAVPPGKAIVGQNAFSHESGIHQQGVLENRETY